MRGQCLIQDYLFLHLEPDHTRARTNLIYMTKENERLLGDSSSKVEKPDAAKKEKKLKPHQRKRYDYKNFDWPTEKKNYRRLCRDEEILTYEVAGSLYYVSIPSQPCFPHLLCNVYHPTSSSDLFIP